MVHGSCLCGQVRFELTGPAQFINHCHCSMCRKVHGAAYGASSMPTESTSTGSPASPRYITISRLPRASAPSVACGSNVPVLEDEGTHVIVPAGALDDDRSPSGGSHPRRLGFVVRNHRQIAAVRRVPSGGSSVKVRVSEE